MSRENVEIIRRFYDAMAQPGRAGAIEFFDPEVVVFNTPDSPETAPYVGHDGVLRWVRSAQEGVGDFAVKADEIIDVDECRVLVVGRVCGEGRASGLLVEISLTTVFTLKDGRVVEARAYDTKADALEAVGLRE